MNSKIENKYKDTLNLPKTSFPMKANLSQREPNRLKKWIDDDVYTRLGKSSLGERGLFCMMALLMQMVIYI